MADERRRSARGLRRRERARTRDGGMAGGGGTSRLNPKSWGPSARRTQNRYLAILRSHWSGADGYSGLTAPLSIAGRSAAVGGAVGADLPIGSTAELLMPVHPMPPSGPFDASTSPPRRGPVHLLPAVPRLAFTLARGHEVGT